MVASGFEPSSAAVARYFARAARHYDPAAVLAREVAQRMAERLDYVKAVPARILDLGCGTGADFPLLSTRYPSAQVVGADMSLPMLAAGNARAPNWRAWFSRRPRPRLVAARAEALPLADRAFGMVWSNFMLHHTPDPLAVFREAHRVLEVEGLFMFSCLGPDTLKELRGIAPGRVHRFIDMHDLGDALVAAGFAEPVMDMEVITLTYADFDALAQDLKHTGGLNARQDRPRGLMGREAARALRAGLEATRRDGRLPITFEIIYGHAWKPQPRTTPEGHAIVRFDPTRRGRPA